MVTKHDWKELRLTITKYALVLGVCGLICFLVPAPYMDELVSKIYDIHLTERFNLVFWSCVAGAIIANVMTAWGRFLSVLLRRLDISLYLNAFMSIIVLLISPLVEILFGVPIPVILSLAIAITSLYWWKWLYVYND